MRQRSFHDRAGARIAGILAIVGLSALLQGCLAGIIAAQAVPGMIGSVAMVGAEDRNPFRTMMPPAPPRTDEELATLDQQLHLAECGDPGSQFWVGSALKNGFNAKPDNVEIHKWFRLAQQGGVAEAAPELAALDAAMTAAEIDEAEMRVREWRPTTEGCPAST